jgi:hypothetical protein
MTLAQSNEPTPEREQHGRIAKMPHRVRVVQAPIDRYEKRGLITREQHIAAERYRDAYELGILGAHNPEQAGGNGGMAGYHARRLDAIRDCHRVKSALGPSLWPLIDDVIVNEKTVETIARAFGKDRVDLFAQLRLGLNILADQFGA